MQISRQQFIDAVEAGIANAGAALNEPERALLRHVARTETRTTYGSFSSYMSEDTCFCPLSAAGIASGTDKDKRYEPFWAGYDKHMRQRERAGGGGFVHDVVG